MGPQWGKVLKPLSLRIVLQFLLNFERNWNGDRIPKVHKIRNCSSALREEIILGKPSST
jgi:hypothetical protein